MKLMDYKEEMVVISIETNITLTTSRKPQYQHMSEYKKIMLDILPLCVVVCSYKWHQKMVYS
jgi:hypothetical protein